MWKIGAEVQLACLPMLDRFAHIEPIPASDHFVNRAESQLSHQSRELLRAIIRK